MYTVTDILKDIQRGILANNMMEDCFSYRLIYFINEKNKSTKHYVDTSYSGLRRSLENIIRNNLSLTNTLVIAQIRVLKDGKSICLLSRSYAFCLDEYFRQVNGEYQNRNNYGNVIYRKRCVNW